MPTYKLNVSTGYAEPMALHDAAAALRATQLASKSPLASPPRAAARSVSPRLQVHVGDATDAIRCVDAIACCMSDSALGG